MSLSLTKFLNAQKKRKTSFEKTDDWQTQKQEYLDELSILDWSLTEDNKQIDLALETLLPDISDRNLILWDRLWPDKNYGWTDVHLTSEEYIHFQAIEALFRSKWNQMPSDWSMIRERKPLDNSSADGIILFAGPPSIPDLFVIKSPKRKTRILLHDYVVNRLVANQIRSTLLPNFPFVFGILKCSFAKEKQVFTGFTTEPVLTEWCENKSDDPQIVMENLRDSVTMSKKLNDLPQEIPLLLAQTLNALFVAYQKHRFSHNDLHLGNVLVRKVPQDADWWIPMQFEPNYYLVTKQIAVIIDFGHATFSIGDTFISMPYIKDSIFPGTFGQSRPLNDIYNLITKLYQINHLNLETVGKKKGEDHLQQMKQLEKVLIDVYNEFFKLFSTQFDLQSKLKKQTNRNLDPDKSLKIETIENLEKFIKQVFRVVFVKQFSESFVTKRGF